MQSHRSGQGWAGARSEALNSPPSPEMVCSDHVHPTIQGGIFQPKICGRSGNVSNGSGFAKFYRDGPKIFPNFVPPAGGGLTKRPL